MEKVSFWTEGEGFTKLLRGFIEEGLYDKVIGVLLDGGMPFDMLKRFFKYEIKFTGDTRNNGDLQIEDEEVKETEEEFANRIYWSWRNYVATTNNRDRKIKHAEWDEKNPEPDVDEYFVHYDAETPIEMLRSTFFEKQKDLEQFKEIFSREELINLIWKKLIRDEGYKINPSPLQKLGSAVILSSGDVIEVEYMGHKEIYPLLYALDLVESPDWTEDNTAIHVTEGQMSGGSIRFLENYNEKTPFEYKQLETLRIYKDSLSMYSGWDTMFHTILDFYNDKYDHGAKFNNLMFLKDMYPHFKTPMISRIPIEFNRVKTAVRTSPLYSLPGLLESNFELKEGWLDEMTALFEKYKDVRPGNEFHYFYQEYIEGMNGVAHRTKDGHTYMLSKNRGDVVQGVKSKERLNHETDMKLREITKELFKDLGKEIQIEFVVTPENEIYIVQLRLLKNGPERTVIGNAPKNMLYNGLTFSKGEVENLTPADVLVVHSDANSEELLGKKALIVTSDVEFSHILALSKTLEIPSLFNTGDVILPEKFSIKAYNKEGFIYLPEN